MAVSTTIPIDLRLYQQAEHDAQLSHRTVAQQIEFWARVGRAALENPDLPVNFIAESLLAMAEPRTELNPFVPKSQRV
jgi:hypothetical protein